MKRILSLAAALSLLAGCAAQSAPSAPAATAPPPTPAPQALTVYAGDAVRPALERYAGLRGVTLTFTDDPHSAGLAVLESPPDGEGWRDLMGDELLAAVADRAAYTESPCYALPLGDTLYAYWADGDTLTALLGEGGAADLQNAAWTEWQTFVETFSDWLEEPSAVQVTLNGTPHTLPENEPEGWTVDSVFSASGTDTALYTAVLLAAGQEPTAESLTGPLNGLCSTLVLENAHSGAVPLLRRTTLTALVAERGAEGCEGLTAIPIKSDLVESDLSTEEYNLTGLLNYPVLTTAGWLAVPAGADEAQAKAAASAILWLYGSAAGETALTQTLCLVTPWDTASAATAPGQQQIRQVGIGILPAPAVSAAAAQHLAEAETALRSAEKPAKADRAAFVQAAAAALTE